MGRMLETVDPTDGKPASRYHAHTCDEAFAAVEACARAQRAWRLQSITRRAELLVALAEQLRTEQGALAQLMATEMGKPVEAGHAEVEKCAWNCEFYADRGPLFLGRDPVSTDATSSYVAFEPLGAILAVMPWNFPLWQVFRFAAPALVAGNTVVLKHASNVPGCALAIARIAREAGLPPDVFRTVLVGSDMVPELIAHPQIAAVTATGSTEAGRAIGRAAGQALKKCVLELGGSDPYIILEDADLTQAAEICARSRLTNSGQSCIAAKRFIVVRAVREAFESRLVENMRKAKVGSPLEQGTEVGPMARVDLRDQLAEQVRASIRAGARVLCGGDVPDRPGAWYPPTVLTDVGPGMPAYEEELFGPVAAVIPVEDEDEAIAVANASSYGLGAAVFTADLERGETIALHRLQAGSCFVNGAVRSDPRLPFGGIKDSGFGRELGAFGIREFVNIKSIWIA